MRRYLFSRFRPVVLVLIIVLATVSLGSTHQLSAQEVRPSARVQLENGTMQRTSLARTALTRTQGTIQTIENCVAPAPALLMPASEATSKDLESPRYIWAAVPSITEYVFQLALDSGFVQLLTTEQENASAQAAQVSHTSFYDLDITSTYYWRVASVCTDGQIGVFSSPFSFKTGTGVGNGPCTLPPPTLAKPADGTQVTTLVPQIVWNRAPNTYEYKYQLSTDQTFATFTDSVTFIGIDPSLSDGITEIPDENLIPGALYYWRIASVCAEIDTTASFSAPFSFRAAPAGGPLLDPPQLTAPEDGATTGSIRMTFLFSTIANAEAYSVRLYDSRAHAEQDHWFESFTPSKTALTTILNPEETVYWRVKTRSSYGWGSFSDIRSFTTPTVNAKASISPTSGGTLSPNPGYLTINFPPGAVTNPTDLDFHLLATPQQSLSNFKFANRAFTLEAVANGQPVNHFNIPYTMVLNYDTSDLVAASISDPTQLNLVFWDGTSWQNILPCAGCSIDTTHRTVTVVLDHFTEFALVAPSASTDTYRLWLPVVLQ